MSCAKQLHMKSSIITFTAATACLLGVATLAPLSAQSSTSGSTSAAGASSSGTTNQAPVDNSAINNHAQGSANNQTPTGGDNAQRRSGSDTH
jgi:hypothetical protein